MVCYIANFVLPIFECREFPADWPTVNDVKIFLFPSFYLLVRTCAKLYLDKLTSNKAVAEMLIMEDIPQLIGNNLCVANLCINIRV